MQKGPLDFTRYGSFGLTWVVATIIYLYGGYNVGNWIDRRLGTEPWFFVAGILLGTVMSLASLAVKVYDMSKASTQNQKVNQDNPVDAAEKPNRTTH